MNCSSLSRLYCIYEKNILHFFKRMKPEKTDNFKKKIKIHPTRLNQLEELWSYKVISPVHPLFENQFISPWKCQNGIQKCISLRGYRYLQMMYFLCVNWVSRQPIKQLKAWVDPDPSPYLPPGSLSPEFSKYIKIVWTIF